MPIIIKDFEWRQTETSVIIKIPLHGIAPSNVDIFYSIGYIKASFGQFLFEALLSYEIVLETSSSTIIDDDKIIFELIKVDPKQWECLEKQLEKKEKLSLKLFYINQQHEKIQNDDEKKKNKKYELKRVAVREQISLESKMHEKIKNIREEEKVTALKGLEELQKKPFKKFLLKSVDPIPELRTGNIVYLEFTRREFPTPCRESRLEEESDWLRKQAEARRSVGFISEDIRPEELNPQFLKDKGDRFVKNRNYLGAISAYSFGIDLNPKFVDLYMARGEAHFNLGNFSKAARDFSEALDLLKPEIELNLKERAFCLGRRGLSLLKLGLKQQGIDELQASIRLCPNREFSEELQNAEVLQESDSEDN